MNKAELLQSGKTIISKEPGNSMLPIIKSREPVDLTPCTVDQVDPGDIVYFKVKGRFYTHIVRAIDSKRGCLIVNAKGHVNGWTRNIYGKVTKIL
jgi:hypothetical protein